MIHKTILGLLAALLVASAIWGNHLHQLVKSSSLDSKLDRIVSVSSEPVQDCAQVAAQSPLVILALGQSNAGNHGEILDQTAVPVMLFAEGKCILAADPLPGSTGNGGSIWSRLPNYLLTLDQKRPVVLSVMGIDATSIAEWTNGEGLLRQQLTNRVQSMKALGLMPHVILWQQGEADAKLGTAKEAYSVGLDMLAKELLQAGTDAPVMAALSTVCRSLPNLDISTAITVKAAQNSRFIVGPNTDRLTDAGSRSDGCHFSASGLDQAARMWAKELRLVFASI